MDLDAELVDVILRTKNSEECLKKCLDSIVREIPIRKMIIVDHEYSDNFRNLSPLYLADIYVKKMKKLGGTHKIWFFNGQDEWVVVIDSDDSPDWKVRKHQHLQG